MANEFKISELERVKTIGSSILGTDRLILNNGNPQTTRAITIDDLIERLPDEVGVAKIIPGSNVSISPSVGDGDVTISVPTGAGGVSRIIPGSYVTVNPLNGRGEVTVSIARGAGGVTDIVAGNNISINPTNGTGSVEITAVIPTFDPGVTRIIPGTGINITPSTGLGEITISAQPVDIPDFDPGVVRIIGGNNVTVNPSAGTGTVTIDATVPDPGVIKITAGDNISISPANGVGNVTITGAPGGTTNFNPIHASFDGLDYQVRFLGSANYSPRGIDEFSLFKRNANGTLTDTNGTVPNSYIGAGGLGGLLSIEGWPISFDAYGGVTGGIATPIDITFPAGSNCAMVIIQQKARILHNFMRSSDMNNTHLAYYTRLVGEPVNQGSFTWMFPGLAYEDEGNTGDILKTGPYITQLAMGHCPAMKGSLHDGSSGPNATLGGLDLCYRYGQDVTNLIIAYCEFTPGVNGNQIRFYHNTRILRSKRSIFDISGASMTFFPLNKTPGGKFPGVAGLTGVLSSAPTNYALAKTEGELSGVEDAIFGSADESNTVQELADDLRNEIKEITSALIATHDYGNLTLADEGLLVTALESLLDLKSTPLVSNGTLGDNVEAVRNKLNEIVYDDDDIMRIGGFRFAFEDEFEDDTNARSTLF